jgi:hypothetical protein
LLGPLLVLPMLGTGVDLAHRGQSWLAVSSHVGVVLLNLCLLLPAVVIEGQYHPLRMGAQAATAWLDENVMGSWRKQMAAPITPPTTMPTTLAATSPTTSPTTVATTQQASTAPVASSADEDEDDSPAAEASHAAVPLPLAVWRVDIVVLIALGLFLVPVALGRWQMTKWEGLGLLAGYIAYLLLAMTLGVRLV